MIVKKIKALKDFTLNTQVDIKTLYEEDVEEIKFTNQKQFDALLDLNNFKEYHKPIKAIGKPIVNTSKPIEPPVVEDKEIITTPEVIENVVVTDDNVVDEDTVKHTCDICDKSFDSAKGLSLHIAKIHKVEEAKKLIDNPKINCPSCGTKMVLTGEENQPGQGVVKHYSCPICGVEERV